MSTTKTVMQKHLADLVLLADLEMEGFDVNAFATEMDELLANLGYHIPAVIVAEGDAPWRL